MDLACTIESHMFTDTASNERMYSIDTVSLSSTYIKSSFHGVPVWSARLSLQQTKSP